VNRSHQFVAFFIAFHCQFHQAICGDQNAIRKPSFPSWCKNDSIKNLGSWVENGVPKQIWSCHVDSFDSQGITVFSKLDVREVNRSSESVIWKISDGYGRGLGTVKLFEPSLSIVDISGTGDYANFFGYIFMHDGADPTEVKFMGHYRGKKYAIRGQIPYMEGDAELYKMEYDKVYSFVNPRFRSIADSLLKAFIVKAHEAGDLTFLPYQMGGVKSPDE
jgi:hypothetical protein